MDRNSRVMRELLSEEVGSSLHEAFRRADKANSGVLTEAAVRGIMSSNGTYPTHAPRAHER